MDGKRLGLYGPGWRDRPLSSEALALYRRAQGELRGRGAVLVEDPFADSGFAAIGKPAAGLDHYDARGMECVPYDLGKYLERLGPDAAIRDFAAFGVTTAAPNAFAPGGVLAFMHQLPDFVRCLADPTRPPHLPDFLIAKEAYLEMVDRVFTDQRLDGLVFPQMRDELPPLHGPATLHETTVCEINIAGLPGVTLPAGAYASGASFNLIFVGRLWSEAELLAMAFDYEDATRYRRAPSLAGS